MTDKGSSRGSPLDGILNMIERVGNKLPDPALLFVWALGLTWLASWLFGGTEFTIPGQATASTIQNQLTAEALTQFFVNMVETFTGFHPLGVVLVALLGVGVAEEAGFINAGIKKMLSFTPAKLLTPMLILVAIVSHTAADAGYVLVIPLGGVLFYAAGRHPLAGIAAAFAGVSGGFSANFIPSGIDPLLQGITQAGAGVLDETVQVNPLCNWFFTGISSILIVGVGWFLTDKVVEPRLRGTAVDGDPEQMPKMEEITPAENRGLKAGLIALAVALLVLAAIALPGDSVLRSKPSVKITLANGKVYEGIQTQDSEAFRKAAMRVAVDDAERFYQPIDEAERTRLAAEHPDEPFAGRKARSVLFLDVGDDLKAFDLAHPLKLHPGFRAEDIEDAVVVQESRRGGSVVAIPRAKITDTEEVSGSLTAFSSPIMQIIVPLILVLFLIPGVVHGFASGSFKSHRDVVRGMSKSMSTMGYYLVMAFFASLFIATFNHSSIGAFLAVKGGEAIQAAGLSGSVTLLGIILLCGLVNLLVGSASAKWALLAPIFVPMLMSLGYSPELTQAAYRVGDSTTNIVTPLMPYFPLVVAFCQRYVKKTGIGTLISIMLPYSISFLVLWSLFLLLYWTLGIPLGLQSSYTYTPPS